MRKVQVFKRQWNQPTRSTILVDDGTAIFHQFGVGFEEYESGLANYTTAIVERIDGTVESVPADCIKFLDPSEPA